MRSPSSRRRAASSISTGGTLPQGVAGREIDKCTTSQLWWSTKIPRILIPSFHSQSTGRVITRLDATSARAAGTSRDLMRESALEFDEDPEEPGEPGWADRLDAVVSQQWQKLLDLSVPYLGRRWAISALFAFVYCVRAYLLKGWYIVSYGLAIYQLSLLIGFLTPQAATYCLRCSA